MLAFVTYFSRASVLFSACACLASPRILCAQKSAESGIVGTVVSEVGGRPLGGAQVILTGGRMVETTEDGHFRIVPLRPADYSITIRRIGYEPVVAHIVVQEGSTVDVDVELKPAAPALLGEVRVTTDSQRSGKLLALERRRAAQSGGTYIMEATLDSARGRSLSDVIRQRVSGARIIMYPRIGAELLMSRRGESTISQQPRADPSDARSPAGCFSQVVLDGVVIYTPSSTTMMAAPDLRRIRPETLVAMEYYAGPATTPPEFGGTGAACGTLVLWTKER